MKMWISRDGNGDLHLHNAKPELLEDCEYWTSFFNNGEDYKIDHKLFPSVTFENSPQQVEIKLI